MEQLVIPRVVVSGTHPGVGKSLLTLGLVYELRRRNHGVSCVVLGWRLGQAVALKRLSGRSTRCVDAELLSSNQVLALLRQAGVGADLLLIDGWQGLFDGRAVGNFNGSDAEFAALTRTPVVLVADVRGYQQSIAALVKGFSDIAGSSRNEGGFDVAGAILNRATLGDPQGAAELEFFSKAFEAFHLTKPLGIVPEFSHQAILPPEQLSQEKNPALFPRQFFVDLGAIVQKHVDVDRLIECAELAPAVDLPDYYYAPLGRRCRIAVSDDSCFNICFQDNLELLRYYGAEIVPFSPLADDELPDRVGAVYLTSGYLAEYARELSENSSMIQSLHEFHDKGGVIYSEGAGTAFLSREFKCLGNARPYSGVGILPINAEQQESVIQRVEGVTIDETVLGRPGIVVKGVDTGAWISTKEDRVVNALRFSRGTGKPTHTEGYSPGAQVLCTFSLLHFGSNPQLAKNLADAAEVVESTAKA